MGGRTIGHLLLIFMLKGRLILRSVLVYNTIIITVNYLTANNCNAQGLQ